MIRRSTPPGFVSLLLATLTIAAASGCGQQLAPDPRPKIIIMWGVDTQSLQGVDVEIDGTVAGKLEPFGDNPRTVFLVDKGKHRVQLRHPTVDCQERVINAERDGQRFTLLVDYSQSSAGGGSILVLNDL